MTLSDSFAKKLAQAICGDDHLMCSWPNCNCRGTKRKINAAALVVAEATVEMAAVSITVAAGQPEGGR